VRGLLDPEPGLLYEPLKGVRLYSVLSCYIGVYLVVTG
jgi:hypothetical protein